MRLICVTLGTIVWLGFFLDTGLVAGEQRGVLVSPTEQRLIFIHRVDDDRFDVEYLRLESPRANHSTVATHALTVNARELQKLLSAGVRIPDDLSQCGLKAIALIESVEIAETKFSYDIYALELRDGQTIKASYLRLHQFTAFGRIPDGGKRYGPLPYVGSESWTPTYIEEFMARRKARSDTLRAERSRAVASLDATLAQIESRRRVGPITQPPHSTQHLDKIQEGNIKVKILMDMIEQGITPDRQLFNEWMKY